MYRIYRTLISVFVIVDIGVLYENSVHIPPGDISQCFSCREMWGVITMGLPFV